MHQIIGKCSLLVIRFAKSSGASFVVLGANVTFLSVDLNKTRNLQSHANDDNELRMDLCVAGHILFGLKIE